MIILMHCRVISKLSIMVTSAKVHIPSMDLEHVSPGTTCGLAEQEDRRRFPLKTGKVTDQLIGTAVRTKGMLTT